MAHATHANASYIASWLAVLRADSRAVFTAARLAQQAAEYFLGSPERLAEIARPAPKSTHSDADGSPPPCPTPSAVVIA
jgi:antirestriction protein ArdC